MPLIATMLMKNTLVEPRRHRRRGEPRPYIIDRYIQSKYIFRMSTSHALATLVITVGMLVSGITDSAARQKPNFSGTWVLNRQASSLPPPVSAVESGVVRIEHREPSFSFRRTYVISGASREASFTASTDGRETTDTGARGETITLTMKWASDVLVLAMRIQGPGFNATNDVRYELLNGGTRLRATEQGRSPQGDHDAVWIYDRQ
ncbi:MAG: hypothetical protein IT178_08220 [Acidobacteria bacterium]|nr:hypothetical protein [Acidobacteriota bacterium]